jgi:hypothetical protein
VPRVWFIRVLPGMWLYWGETTSILPALFHKKKLDKGVTLILDWNSLWVCSSSSIVVVVIVVVVAAAASKDIFIIRRVTIIITFKILEKFLWHYPHRSFIPQASNTFRSFFLESKLQILVFMVTSLPLCPFWPTVKYVPWFPWLHHLKMASDVTWKPKNAKRSQPIVEQGWMVQVMHPPHKVESQRF